MCYTHSSHIHTATLLLKEKCDDPVTVELILERNGEIVFQGNFTESSQVEKFGSVDMQRNDTHLQFSVSVKCYHTVWYSVAVVYPH